MAAWKDLEVRLAQGLAAWTEGHVVAVYGLTSKPWMGGAPAAAVRKLVDTVIFYVHVAPA